MAAVSIFLANFLSNPQACLEGPQINPFKALTVNNAICGRKQFRKLDFVITQKEKHYWKITDKLFNYDSKYRRVEAL